MAIYYVKKYHDFFFNGENNHTHKRKKEWGSNTNTYSKFQRNKFMQMTNVKDSIF